jgi:hypothetical protein
MLGAISAGFRAFVLWAFYFFMFICQPAFAQDQTGAQASELVLWERAIVAVEKGDHQAALGDLESLVSLNPANANYRFELALTLYRLEQDGRARYHLGLLDSTALQPGARHAVGQLTEKINTRRRLTGYFSFGLRPESNVGRQTESKTVLISGLPFELEQSGEPGVSGKINAGLSYGSRLSPRLHARLRADLAAKLNKDAAYRDISVTGRAGLQFSKTTRSAIAGGLLLGTRWIGDAPYSDTVGAYIDYAQQAGAKGRLNFNMQFANTRHKDRSPDHNIILTHLSYAHGISVNAQLRFGVFHQHTSSADKTAAGTNTGLTFGADYAFRGGLVAGVDLSVSRDTRDGFNVALFSEARKDEKIKAELRLHHRDIQVLTFAPQLIVGIERNKSNNALVDFTNEYMTIGFTRKF